jgi:hypothetical protein
LPVYPRERWLHRPVRDCPEVDVATVKLRLAEVDSAAEPRPVDVSAVERNTGETVSLLN